MSWFGWVLWHINYCGLFNAKSFLYIYIRYLWFGLVWFGFMAYKQLMVIWCQIILIHTYQIYMTWFVWILWHISHCRLFYAESSLHVYIKYIWSGLVGFYGISIIVAYLVPNHPLIYISNIYELFGWVLWHINHCRLFNAKSFLYIYIKYLWFGLVKFNGISTIVGYLMPDHFYTYILDIYDLVCLGFMAYQPLYVI